MHASILGLLQLESDLRAAVERNELVLWYQPIVSLSSGRIEVSRRSSVGSILSAGIIVPSEFIPVAEESGLIGRSASG